jgi:hypothetical protein
MSTLFAASALSVLGALALPLVFAAFKKGPGA